MSNHEEIVGQRLKAFEKSAIPTPPSLDDDELAWVIDCALLLRRLIVYANRHGSLEFREPNYTVDYPKEGCTGLGGGNPGVPTQGWMEVLVPRLIRDPNNKRQRKDLIVDLYCATRRVVDILMENGGCIQVRGRAA